MRFAKRISYTNIPCKGPKPDGQMLNSDHLDTISEITQNSFERLEDNNENYSYEQVIPEKCLPPRPDKFIKTPKLTTEGNRVLSQEDINNFNRGAESKTINPQFNLNSLIMNRHFTYENESNASKEIDDTISRNSTHKIFDYIVVNDNYDELNLSAISKEHSKTLEKIRKMNNKFILQEKREETIEENKNIITKTKHNPFQNKIDPRVNIIPISEYKSYNMIDNFDQFALSSIRSSVSNTKEDFLTKNKELIIPINSKQTNINKLLKVSEKDIKINRASLSYLNENSVIYDMDILKIYNLKNLHKLSFKYCQLTKNYFKYFKSIYSATVWQDRPLLRIPISNINNIIIVKCRNNIPTMLKNNKLNIIIRFYIKFDKSKFISLKNLKDFPFNPNYEFLQIPNSNEENLNQVDYILQFGTDSEESGISFVKIIKFLKTLLF